VVPRDMATLDGKYHEQKAAFDGPRQGVIFDALGWCGLGIASDRAPTSISAAEGLGEVRGRSGRGAR